jgi:hypothetical protein
LPSYVDWPVEELSDDRRSLTAVASCCAKFLLRSIPVKSAKADFARGAHSVGMLTTVAVLV